MLAPFLALVLALGAQDVETRSEDLPDGGRVEREVRVTAERDAVDHGTWRSWHANGQAAAEGSCVDGLRQGPWKTWHASGTLASEGEYEEGFRKGKWSFFDEEGGRDRRRSGTYKVERETYGDGQPRLEEQRLGKNPFGEARWFLPSGETRCVGVIERKNRVGPWTWFWGNGEVQLEGEYDRGKPVGEWLFRHATGYLDPTFLSGTYDERGRFVGELEEGGVPPADSALFDVAGYGDLPRPAWLDAEVEQALSARFAQVAVADADVRDLALAELRFHEMGVVVLVLERIRELDLFDAEGNEEARGLAALLPVWHWAREDLAWRGGTAPEDIAHDRRTLLRWTSIVDVVAGRKEVWSRFADATRPELLEVLFGGDPTEGLGGPVRQVAIPAVWTPPKAAKALGAGGVEQTVRDGLAWLLAHQNPNGFWDASGKSWRCDCEGKAPGVDLGVTGLAVLALTGTGSTVEGGEFREPIARAVDWMLSLQHAKTGVFPSRSHSFIYQHTIALRALIAATEGVDDPPVRWRIRRGIDFLLEARNAYSGWRYDVPPTGDNDTSVTSWALEALHAARRAGYSIDPAALNGGMSWIEEVTDPATGRVGYDSFGSLSSRSPANEHHPVEKGEAMTGAGAWCRLLDGQTPEEDGVLMKHADLMQRSPPEWDPEGYGCDLYYWHWGTYAMFGVGGKFWKRWNEPLKKALLGSQRMDKGHARGSWDPVGPWGYAGGRVYSTAMALLCLEVYFRYPLAER